MIRFLQIRYKYRQTLKIVRYFGIRNDFRIEKSKAASKNIMRDLKTSIRKYIDFMFVKNINESPFIV